MCCGEDEWAEGGREWVISNYKTIYITTIRFTIMSIDIINQLWGEATTIPQRDPEVWRMDPCGAIIKKEDYGDRESEYGWEIDHVVSKSFLLDKGADEDEIGQEDNLRAMHWANNESKGTDYPEYLAVRSSDGEKNIKIEAYYTVSASLQKKLRILYQKYGL